MTISKKLWSLFLLCMCCFVVIQSHAQERFNIFARAGVKKLQTNAFVDINRGEAYIRGIEANIESPFFFGLDFTTN